MCDEVNNDYTLSLLQKKTILFSTFGIIWFTSSSIWIICVRIIIWIFETAISGWVIWFRSVCICIRWIIRILFIIWFIVVTIWIWTWKGLWTKFLSYPRLAFDLEVGSATCGIFFNLSSKNFIQLSTGKDSYIRFGLSKILF